jgi:hypothetical protein
MNKAFVVPPQNIQAVISMLLAYSYSQEYVDSINWNRDACDNEFMYDCSLAVNLLGGRLINKSDFNDLN